MADKTLGIERVGETLALRQLAAVKASKRVVQDVDLTWPQIQFAKNNLLAYLNKASKWPRKHIDTLMEFFLNLELHPMMQLKDGEAAIILYAGRDRREWHDCLKIPGRAYNLSLINDNQLAACMREVCDTAYQREIQEVSPSVPPLSHHSHSDLSLPLAPPSVCRHTCYCNCYTATSVNMTCWHCLANATATAHPVVACATI